MLVIRSVDNICYSNKTAETPRYVHADRRSCYCHYSALVRQTGEEITERCCHSIIGTQWGSDRDQANSARKRRQRKKTRHRIRGLTQRSSKLRCHHFACRSFDVTGKPFPFSFWALMLCMLLYCSGFRGIFGRPAEASRGHQPMRGIDFLVVVPAAVRRLSV